MKDFTVVTVDDVTHDFEDCTWKAGRSWLRIYQYGEEYGEEVALFPTANVLFVVDTNLGEVLDV